MQRLKYSVRPDGSIVSQTIVIDNKPSYFLLVPLNDGINVSLRVIVEGGENDFHLGSRKSKHTAYRLVKDWLVEKGFPVVKESRKKRK